MRKHLQITIQGTVQGVGFRPFVFREAVALDLSGYVANTSQGVVIFVEGEESMLQSFLENLKANCPSSANITDLHSEYGELEGYQHFEICSSEAGECDLSSLIPPDSAICPDCLEEMKDPKNRRYQYPFINCVNCGPRYSIVRQIPYDRPYTSMDVFEMCPACEKEYSDPMDRRYHAQPISCPECGPRLSLHRANGSELAEGKKAIDAAAKLIRKGHIVAIKGIGGFHLVCDASKNQSVLNLREKKNRPDKPFAVMLKNIHEILKCSEITPEEAELIQSPERPIVLITKRKPHRLENFCISCDGIAPNIDKIGVFLPYTPIHVMLMELVKCPIIATSANLSDEPIITDSQELREKLEGVFDYYLDYDREIVNPCDDSVVALQDGALRYIRKARGYAPECIKLPRKLEKKVLAVGGHLKNTIAVGFGDNAALSPHIGDLSGLETMAYFEKTLRMFEGVYGFEPDVIVCDRHPEYESTKWAKQQNVPVLEVQHHYAHVLSLMAEHQLDQPILGVAWDGTGYGDDGTLWGGEFFHATLKEYQRIFHFKPFKLLGGEKAVKEPRRVALAILFDLYGKEAFHFDIPTIHAFSNEELETLYEMYEKSINAPLCSSVGRIFDAVVSLCGVVQNITYEGESGLRMETLFDPEVPDEPYPYTIEDGVIDISGTFREIIGERDRIVALSRFSATLCHIVATIAKETQLPVGLTGGVFQNKILTQGVVEVLKKEGIPYYLHHKVPCNDGGISLGQILHAAHSDIEGER